MKWMRFGVHIDVKFPVDPESGAIDVAWDTSDSPDAVRLKAIAERYATTVIEADSEVAELGADYEFATGIIRVDFEPMRDEAECYAAFAQFVAEVMREA